MTKVKPFTIFNIGYHLPVQKLFKLIGKNLSQLAVALVAGLECFYSCPDSSIRGICVTALATMIHENEKIFLQEDQLAAIWNLYFLLCSFPDNSKFYIDRIVVIKSLGQLADIYSTNDPTSTERILASLLRLTNKTSNEIAEIQKAVTSIFENIGQSTDGKNTSRLSCSSNIFDYPGSH
jgi:hypothetical protein